MRRTTPGSKLRALAKITLGAALSATTLGVIAACIKFVIEPGYTNPKSRMYTSRLGHASLVRNRGGSFPVRTVRVSRQTIETAYLGDGLMQSEPVQVSVIPVGTIAKVWIREGDVVARGQLLAEVDAARARLRLQAAQVAYEAAEAELQRVKLGTHYQHAQERPAHDAIRLKAAAYEAAARKELAEIYEELTEQKLVPRAEILRNNIQRAQALANVREAERALEMAEKGRQHSLRIANAAVRSAAIGVQHAERDLVAHKIYAPVDGIIERCVIHEGDYIQASGRPACLIAAGLWFEAHFDQCAIDRFRIGDQAEISLEAFAERAFHGRVEQIRRIVSYSQGGPEINRPLRPRGTGSPEWPATFAVRIVLDPAHEQVVPGLTGFARITTSKAALAVPRAALVGVSGRKALVYVVAGKSFLPRNVTLGRSSEEWVEVAHGLGLGEEVIVDGHRVLESGDRISVIAADPATRASGSHLAEQ